MATFAKLFDNVTIKLKQAGVIDTLSSQFKEFSTDKERMAFILETDIVMGVIDQWCSGRPRTQKSSVASESTRLEGNMLFKKGNFSGALEKYTESAFSAEYNSINSPCLAMALANRSAALFQTNSYLHARKDAEMAMRFGYPEKLLYKLLERIGKCYMKEGNFANAKRCFRDALLALSKSELTIGCKNKLALQYHKFETICASSKEDTLKNERDGEPQINPEQEKVDCNAMYTCATSAFSIISDSLSGRHAVATRDINVGELIIFEKAFASVLFHENRLTHCHHCFGRCKTLIGCIFCDAVGFCSEICREMGWKKYHSVECRFINHLYVADTGFGHLALRTILTAGLQYLMDFDDNLVGGLDNSDQRVYDSMSYLSVYGLIGHSKKRSLSDLFRRSVLAAFLLKFIDQEDFFTSELSGDSLFKKKLCIGSHILKQLQMLPCNAHEVSELRVDKSSIADSELKEIGSAIYATLSLLNHSCDPSVVRYSYGSSCALRTIKKIPKGGMIVDNYGAVYAVSTLNDRQDLVSSQYYFNCCCEACLNDWPLYNLLPNESPQLKCSNCEFLIRSSHISTENLCPNCEVKLPISMLQFEMSRSRFKVAMNAVLEGADPKQQLPILLSHLQLMCDTVQLPWQEFNNCQEIVKQCFGMLGNHYFM